MTTEEKKIEEAAKDHCLYDRNICEEDDALCNLSEQMFILGAKSDAAKVYHTKGMFTQEQLDERLDLQACETTAQVIKNLGRSFVTEEQCYQKLHDLMVDIKLNGVIINDDTDLKQWFENNKTT